MVKKLIIIFVGLVLVVGVVVFIALIPKLQAMNQLVKKFHTDIRQGKTSEAYGLLCKDPPPEDQASFSAFAEAYKQRTDDKFSIVNDSSFSNLEQSVVQGGKKRIAAIADTRHVGHRTMAATSGGAEILFGALEEPGGLCILSYTAY